MRRRGMILRRIRSVHTCIFHLEMLCGRGWRSCASGWIKGIGVPNCYLPRAIPLPPPSPRASRLLCPSTFGNDRFSHRPARFRRRENSRGFPLFLSDVKRVVVHGTSSLGRLVTRDPTLLPRNFHIQIVLDIERMFQPNVRGGGPLENARANVWGK